VKEHPKKSKQRQLTIVGKSGASATRVRFVLRQAQAAISIIAN
jgi:hypothetical protein